MSLLQTRLVLQFHQIKKTVRLDVVGEPAAHRLYFLEDFPPVTENIGV
jgi:hypothetical protein